MAIAPPEGTPVLEKKETTDTPPATTPPATTPPAATIPPATTPPAETLEQKAARLEKELKDRDTKIGDLSTTISTIEERQRQLDLKKNEVSTDTELEKELEEIETLRMTDPVGAVKRNADLLKKIAASASQKAQGAISQQAMVEKLRAGVKTSNPDFDDDVVDYVMERADALARTGKFKTADEAIQAATTLVKSKFDGYASKKNAVPPLPAGAQAEDGTNRPPAPVQKDAPIPSPAEELNERKQAQLKKIL